MGCLEQPIPSLKTSKVIEASLLLPQEVGKSQVKNSQCSPADPRVFPHLLNKLGLQLPPPK